MGIKKKMTFKEYKAISKESELSIITITKWFDNSLSVKPSTEQRIISSWLKLSKKSNLGIDKQIHDNKVVISKLEAMNELLETEKEIIQNRLALIAEL